jgi:uncharacterized protein (DUF1330 family)
VVGGELAEGFWAICARESAGESAVKAYAALTIPAIESFGGRLLTGPLSQVEPHEAGMRQLTIVVEFESYDRAVVAYKSEAYRKALDALGSGRIRISGLLRGCESECVRCGEENAFAGAKAVIRRLV